MVLGCFVLTLLASAALSAYGARRSEHVDVARRSDIPRADAQQVQSTFTDLVRDFSPVGSLLQRGVAVHASALANATANAPHLKIEVSPECLTKVKSASPYCQKESVWFYKCAQENADRSFPLDEVCLAEVNKHSELKGVTTGCCNDHPFYKGGCCKPTAIGLILTYCLLFLPFACCGCCGGLIYVVMTSRKSMQAQAVVTTQQSRSSLRASDAGATEQ
eukprot:TRINITY_DN13342_c0_g1_i1.p1 TRINITY_DN13342_c0_g1~~TRINITY_DN13342_c0_g1_i1.p1  ORF type:complete len:219 (-),score=24.13 TRINITY_DN13342_c0_g1_i1:44-700(-)